MAAQSNEPITLDDSDEEEGAGQAQPGPRRMTRSKAYKGPADTFKVPSPDANNAQHFSARVSLLITLQSVAAHFERARHDGPTMLLLLLQQRAAMPSIVVAGRIEDRGSCTV